MTGPSRLLSSRITRGIEDLLGNKIFSPLGFVFVLRQMGLSVDLSLQATQITISRE